MMGKNEDRIRLSHGGGILSANVSLPNSKSISNRLLVLNALAECPATIIGLSTARDTETLSKLLNSESAVLDVGDAGTAMRFLLAYCALCRPGTQLCGTERMHERPLHGLIDALRQLGAKIVCLGKEGFAPLRIDQTLDPAQRSVAIRGDVSSQFISALMMVAPRLENGLEINLTTALGSRPYVEMTAACMARFGVQVTQRETSLHIPPMAYEATYTEVEPDWSAASYWYGMAAIAEKSNLKIIGLKKTGSWQGDAKIDDMMRNFGVQAREVPDGILLEKEGGALPALTLEISDQPDLAQTLMVTAAACGTELILHGCGSLRLKETDRIVAMAMELAKFGILLESDGDTVTVRKGILKRPDSAIDTYHDHRMAMSLSLLALRVPMEMNDPHVTAKSYPGFWTELNNAGFSIENF